MSAKSGFKVLLFGLLAVLLLNPHPAEPRGRRLPSTVNQLLDLEVKPFAIGHRGFGDNLGEDPTRPIENTVAAVRAGFQAGSASSKSTSSSHVTSRWSSSTMTSCPMGRV